MTQRKKWMWISAVIFAGAGVQPDLLQSERRKRTGRHFGEGGGRDG